MKQLRRLTVPALLVAALIFPLTLAEAQRGKRAQRRANQQEQRTASAQGAATQQGSAAQTESAGQGERRRRRRRDGSSPGTSASNTNARQQEGGQSVTVVRRINQLRLSAAASGAFGSLKFLRGVVAVRGNTIRPLAGSSLWQLSNGAHILIGGSTVEPLSSEIGTVEIFPGMVLVWACYCPKYDDTEDDGCKFESRGVCKQTGNVECTCKFEDFVIDDEGKVHGFEGVK